MKFTALFATLCLALAGCSSVQMQKDPAADLGRLKKIFVEHRLADDHHLDELITAELRSLGIEATSGPLTMQPDRVDAVITYTDRWEWDFQSYMIEFNMRMRDARTDRLLAEVNYYHPAVLRKEPKAMLHEVLSSLFRNRKVQSKVIVAPTRDPQIPDRVRENLPPSGK
jgi:hypothetical protein